MNHLLVVGFYLINTGFVALALRFGVTAVDVTDALESLSTKVGLVLMVLGFMHFFNLAVFASCRKRALIAKAALPPALPATRMTGV